MVVSNNTDTTVQDFTIDYGHTGLGEDTIANAQLVVGVSGSKPIAQVPTEW
jgi:hypothetical protein